MTPAGTERHHLSRSEFMHEIAGDLDPLKYAGEGYHATEEMFPQDIQDNPQLLGDLIHEGTPYPHPIHRKKR